MVVWALQGRRSPRGGQSAGGKDTVISGIIRRKFLTLLGGTAAASLLRPGAARAQQPAMPVVGFIYAGSADGFGTYAAAFRKGLNEAGYVEGQNVTVEFPWRRAARPVSGTGGRSGPPSGGVIATPASVPAALAAKAATETIPIVFGVGEDPVKLGLVASLARPAGNVTGINFFIAEFLAKRLGAPAGLAAQGRAYRCAGQSCECCNHQSTWGGGAAAPAIGLQIQVYNATTIGEIDVAFAALRVSGPMPS